MRNCRDISILVSRELDQKLSLRKRFSVWLHVMMCTRCRNFQKQTQFIRKAARHYADDLQCRFNNKS